jgi:hypothetical protein
LLINFELFVAKKTSPPSPLLHHYKPPRPQPSQR